MKQLKQIRISDNFLFRRPVYPLINYSHREFYEDPFFLEAIRLSSINFFETLNSGSKKDKAKITHSLFKYLLRMSTKPIPFGLFAGVGVGVFNESLSDINEQSVSLDLKLNFRYYRDEVYNKLFENENLLLTERYSLNETLYKVGNTYRYIERRSKSKHDVYKLSKIISTQPINHIVKLCQKNQTGQFLVESLIANNYTDSKTEAMEFIRELLATNIIYHREAYCMLSPNFHQEILKKPEYAPFEYFGLVSDFDKIRQDVAESKFYLKNNFGNRNFFSSDSLNNKLKRYVDVNTIFTDRIHLRNNLKFDLKKGFVSLYYLCDPLFNIDTDLKQFIKDFEAKYEGMKVPLLHALDPDVGIGFSNYTAHNVTKPDIFDFDSSIYDNHNSTEFPIKHKLPERYRNSESQTQVINFDSSTLYSVSQSELNIPKTTTLIFELLQSNETDHPLIYIKIAGGASASNLVTRFASNNKLFDSYINEITGHETDRRLSQNTIYAELSYLPQLVSGSSILNRKNYLDFEIPIFNNSSKDPSFTIKLKDLFLQIVNGELILLHKSGKRVVPRNTSAHDFRLGSNHIYFFLSTIQEHVDVKHRFVFNWQKYTVGDICPRITVDKNIAFSLTKWVVRAKDISRKDLKKALLEEKIRLNIPDRVWLYQNFEERIFIDFCNNDSVEMLIKEVFGSDAIFEEYLPPFKHTSVEYNYEYLCAILNLT